VQFFVPPAEPVNRSAQRGFEPELGEQRPERRKRAPSLVLCPAHHDEIVGVADEHALPACL